MSEQTLFTPPTTFAESPEQRTACVLLLDVSSSMAGEPIAQLNAGVQSYKEALVAHPLAAKRVEVAIVTFGGRVQTVCEFTTVDGFQPPTLVASGDTPMGAAIVQGIELLKQRKEQYKSNGVPYTRPWVFVITDGAPTDDWHAAAAAVQQGEHAQRFLFWSVGVEGASFDVLRQLSTRSEPLKLKGLAFPELFMWLAGTQIAASQSKPGETVPLENPIGPKGWGEAII
jgi:uncharacterized protein YegL